MDSQIGQIQNHHHENIESVFNDFVDSLKSYKHYWGTIEIERKGRNLYFSIFDFSFKLDSKINPFQNKSYLRLFLINDNKREERLSLFDVEIIYDGWQLITRLNNEDIMIKKIVEKFIVFVKSDEFNTLILQNNESN